MEYTVKDLLESNKFQGITLIGEGDSGINREIHGIRIIEVSDMERYLSGGELLMTSLKAYDDMEEKEFLSHREAFEKKQISGFIVKRTQETVQQKRLFELLLQFSKTHHLPVVEIPKDTYYWGILKYVLMQVFDLETAKLSYFKITHDNLNFILLNNKEILKVIDNVVVETGRMVGNPVSLYSGNFTRVATTNPEFAEFQKAADFAEYQPNVVTKDPYIRQKREYVEYIKQFEVFDNLKFYLVITEMNEALTELDFIGLENAITALQYLLMRSATEENIARKYHEDLGYRLLSGSLTSAEEAEVATILGFSKKDPLRVVTCQIASTVNEDGRLSSEQMKVMEKILTEVMRHFPEKYIYCGADQIIYIHKAGNEEEELEFRKQMENMQQDLKAYFVHKNTELNFLIGIGKCVKNYHFLKESFQDSKVALKYIGVIRKIMGDKDKAVVDSSNLGFFKAFVEMNDKEQLQSYIPESLRKLYQYDEQKKGNLIHTLECYLNNNQSMNITSKVMYVHYRTVVYRLQKIVEISGMNFDNPTEMLAVRNGLIIYRILEEM